MLKQTLKKWFEDVNWIHLAPVREGWSAIANIVTNVWVPLKFTSFLE
jgi:hypothetical protein